MKTVFLLFSIISLTLGQNTYDDDDYFNNDEPPELPGNINLQVSIYNNDIQCFVKEPTLNTTVYFNLPKDCSCLNSAKYCRTKLLKSHNFITYNWTQNFPGLDLPISSCIRNNSFSIVNGTCFPCQDYTLQVDINYDYLTCEKSLIFLVALGGIIMSIFLILVVYTTVKNRRRNYERLENNSDTKTYVFYRAN